MKTLIAVPCMDMVHTMFFRSMMALERPDETEVLVSSSSLIYDARNTLAKQAIEGNYDRVLWIDSDMIFEPDLLRRFHADLDNGLEYVTGLAFSRRAPIKPCIFRTCGIRLEGEKRIPFADFFDDIPDKPMFQVAASGFAAVMTTVDLLKRVQDKFGLPFSPVMGFGEDLTFCMRATDLGVPMWCDSRIKLGHIGQAVFDYNGWLAGRGVT